MIKIGFDISQSAFRGGVAIYSQMLSWELSQNYNLEMVFLYSSLRKRYSGNLKNVKKYFLPPALTEILFNQLRIFPIETLLGKIDIYHSSDWIQAPSKAYKVTTYHDVVPLKYPKLSHPKIISVHKRRLELVEKEIDMVIAVSNSTKKDLLEVSKIPAEKITVIYEGVSKQFQPQNEEKITAFKKKQQLPEEFILAIGGVGERRNLDRVRQAANSYPLIISNQTIPYLSEEEMPLLYSSARLLLYPSLYEGFGLPVLEAMACGCPVVTSNVSSLPEIGGEAALYADPFNVDEIKNKVKQLMGDDDLRKKLVGEGFKQAKKFSWEKCAKETAGIYQQIFKKS